MTNTAKVTPENLVAVRGSAPDAAGAIVWWRLEGHVELERLAANWEAAGLDPELLPGPLTPVEALRSPPEQCSKLVD